ncbi:trypsin-like serine protease [Microbacterium sp.]|uniref:trypsin-like serine protease n=1 Tax=Microbacterium sp. TaxID=51671 RepID=UPI003919AA15
MPRIVPRRLPAATRPVPLVCVVAAALAFVLTLVTLTAAPARAAEVRATAASACTYAVCNLLLVNVNGSSFVNAASESVKTTLRTGNVDFTLSAQDVGDGSVYLRNAAGKCLYAGNDSRSKLTLRACTGSADQRWYFQNQDYANSFAIRKVSDAQGKADDRCVDVTDGKLGKQLQLLKCKSSSSNWQKFSPTADDSKTFDANMKTVQDLATKWASHECEKATIVTCTFLHVSTSEPVLTTPVAVGAPAHNYTQGAMKSTIKLDEQKSTTMTLGWGLKYSMKISVDAVFGSYEWAMEQSFTYSTAWTDTSVLSQAVEVTVPANGFAWASWAQLTRSVTGTVTFQTKDTKKSWTAQSTVVLPAKDDGAKKSQLVFCDNTSRQKVCLDSRPTPARTVPAGPSVGAGVDWLVTVQDSEHTCSGTALSDAWVLSSQHCPRGEVVYPGTADPVSVDRVVDSPTGDIRLLHLRTPRALRAYPPVDLAYAPTTGDAATGFSVGTPDAPSPTRAAATVSGTGTDALGGGTLITVDASAARALTTDSGGPLLVNGRVVGVAAVWNGDTGRPVVSYASLRSSASVVAAEIVTDVTVNGTHAVITIGKNLFRSKSRVMVWADGRYAGETYDGTSYYMGARENADATMTLWADVPSGALVQVGATEGVPGMGDISVAKTRVQRSAIGDAGLRVTFAQNGRMVFETSRKLFDAQRRLIVSINDVRVGETYAGSSYDMPREMNARTAWTYSSTPVARGDEIEVRLATGAPGQNADDYVVLSQTFR